MIFNVCFCFDLLTIFVETKSELIATKVLKRSNFRSYQLARRLYKMARGQNLPFNLKDQFEGAASSIVLNLAEGSAGASAKEKKRFYIIAFASPREAQALIDIEDSLAHLKKVADQLGASLYKLTH